MKAVQDQAPALVRHALSAAYPSMPGHEIDALAADIKANGLLDEITLFEGQILDGWNRYRACEIAGVEPRFRSFPEDADPVAFVRSRNHHRRHCDESQRAVSEVILSEYRKGGRPGNRAPVPGLRTNAEMAAAAEVSERTIKNAKAAVNAGLGPAVAEGVVSAKRAAEIAKAAPKKAKKIAKAVAEGDLPAAKEVAAKPLPKILPRPEAAPKKKAATSPSSVVPIKPDEPEPSHEDFGPSAEELAEAEIEMRLQRESYDRILAADDKAAALDAEVKRLHSLLKVEIGQKNRFMNEANEWKRRAMKAERKLKAAA